MPASSETHALRPLTTSFSHHRLDTQSSSPVSAPGVTSAPRTLVGMTRSSVAGGADTRNGPRSTIPTSDTEKQTSYRLNAAFFLFGLLNNSLYVVILTAALELLPKGVPTGVVSFANIFPALIAKAVWPYMLKGTVRYTKRVWSCAMLSFVGMLLVSFFQGMGMRLAGISLASFSSGLGELTFLQLSTRYAPKVKVKTLLGLPSPTNFAGDGVGWFASGTGAAGLVGAAAWWIVRPLGVKLGMLILSILPGFMLLAYLIILPSVQDLLGPSAPPTSSRADRGTYEAVPTAEFSIGDDDDEADAQDGEEDEEGEQQVRHSQSAHSNGGIVQTQDRDEERVEDGLERDETGALKVRLSFQEKMALLRPMLLPYILPLVVVYFAEYTINQGVAPTLIYPLPTRSTHPLLSMIIKKLSDYYPLYQLVYQTFVFLSRSSISVFRLPAIPKKFLWAPAILQSALLALLISESLQAWFRQSIASPLVIVLICIEGLAGGSAYVSVFYSIGMNDQDGRRDGSAAIALPNHDHVSDTQEAASSNSGPEEAKNQEYLLAKKAQEHEFRIGCVGFGDSLGILAASIISMPLQVGLCDSQVKTGRDLCRQV